MLVGSIPTQSVMAALPKKPTMKSLLTPRELETVLLMADGHSDFEIAVELDISKKTVQQHTWAVHRKLGIPFGNGRKANVHITKRALREGLIDLDERVA